MMKRLFIALMLSLIPFVGTLADGVRFLVVNAKDGTKTTFALADEPKLTLSNGELKIVSSNRTFLINFAEIQNYAFLEESTGIEEVITDGNVKLENGFVVFKGLAGGSVISVYMQNGMLVKESKAGLNGLGVIDLSGLPKGILILQSNKTNIKVINR